MDLRAFSTDITPKLFKNKVVKLVPFNKEIPEATQNRFYDLKELFDKPLYDYLSKSKARFGAISMKLKFLGESEETAGPWIIVLSDKAVSKKIRQFFNQPSVKGEYQPSDADCNLPSFELAVINR